MSLNTRFAYISEYFLIPRLLGKSYLAGLGIDYWKKGGVVFNTIPPLFWPILSASIVLAGIGLKIRDYREGKKHKTIARRKARLERTENTFEKVRSLYMLIMQVGPDFRTWDYRDVTSEAWECVRSIRPELIEKRGEEVVPEIIDVGNILSVGEWYDFLIDEKARCRREHEELSH